MEIKALKLYVKGSAGELTRSVVKIQSAHDLENAKKEAGAPFVYIVLENDLSELRETSDLVKDRGEQHKATHLAKILLGQDKIPQSRCSGYRGDQPRSLFHGVNWTV